MTTTRSLLAGLLLAASSSLALAADAYTIDSAHTFLGFHVNHLGFSNAQGRFAEITGGGQWDNANLANCSLELKVKTASVNTDNAKRDEHLRGPDFFDAAQYPVITFTSKSFKSTGKDSYDVTGTLDMHGVKKTVTLPIRKIGEGENPWKQHVIGFDSRFTLNRTDYGINYMPDGLGKEVTLHLSLEATRK